MPLPSQRRATGSSRGKSASDKAQTPKPKRQSASSQEVESQAQSHLQPGTLPFDTQQLILNVFANAFAGGSGGGDNDEQTEVQCNIKRTTQEVKNHLFHRDFAAAFSKSEYLDAYALRWSAARALAYTHIFSRPHRRLWFMAKADDYTSHSDRQHQDEVPFTSTESRSIPAPSIVHPCKVVCVGGGAGAEVVALAAALKQSYENEHSTSSTFPPMCVTTVDIADWEAPLSCLYTYLTEPPPISPHASQAIKEANRPFLHDAGQLELQVLKRDVMSLTPDLRADQLESRPIPLSDQADEMRNVFKSANLVTLMFTLNELFSQSIPGTTSFLLGLTDVMKPHSWLVVVDSPGSYSEIRLGKSGEPKKYPMSWLLDHALLKVAVEDEGKKWEKVEDEESVWFRINQHSPRNESDESAKGGKPKKLRYPIDLENTRYQIHVYRRQP